MQLICEVEEVFEISGVGCVILPHAPSPDAWKGPINVGARLLIETPSGSLFETILAGVQMVSGTRHMDRVPFSLAKDVRKTDVPIGSKVFLLQGDPTSQNARTS